MARIVAYLLLWLFLVSSLPLFAGPQVPKIVFEKYALPNGLQVILHVDRKLPVVHVNEWFHVGSKLEKVGKTGFAHLFEHMMFQGSRNVPGRYLAHAERIGANLRAGGVNGTTDFDRTNYFITAPSGALEHLLWLESDRLTGLLDAMTQEKLDNQRDVVKNERRQGLENVPYGRAWDLMFQYLFPPRHPYSWPVIGSMEDLSAASLDDVKEFFRTYYTPNNLTLTIAGDFEPDQAKKLVAKYFGPIPPGPALARPAKLPSSLDNDRLLVISDRVQLAKTYLAWPGVSYFDPAEADLDLASSILADGLSSRLQKTLIYDRQVCAALSASDLALECAGVFLIDATARPGVSLEDIEKTILAEIHRLATDGPTKEEIERARNKFEYGFVSGLERIGGFGGKADQLARYNTYLGRPDMFEADLGRYWNCTPETIKTAVARYLDGRPHLTMRFLPEASTRVDGKDIDRTKSPELAPDHAFRTPEVRTAKLENGLTILVVENHELPKVAVTLVARAGSAREDVARAGMALLTAKTLDKGTASRSAIAIVDDLAALGTEMSVGQGTESMVASLQVLKRNLDASTAIFADVISNPAFPEAEIERERKKLLDELLQVQQDPNRIAQRVMAMLSAGAEHPYGHPALGTEETLKKLGRSDLVGYFKKYFVPSNAALVLAGDVTLDEARALAKKHFDTWKGAAVDRFEVPPLAPAKPGKIYLVDRQDAAQSVLCVSMPGLSRSSPDYHTLQVLDAAFGGVFGARLNMNLREKKGYSYGMFSSPVFFRTAGWWQAAGGVQTKVTKEAAVEVIAEIERLTGSRPLGKEELVAAKANKVRGYAQGFEMLAAVSGKVGGLWALERPFTDLVNEPVELDRVTLEQANALARKLASPKTALVIVVGDASKIEPGLKQAGLGDIVRLDTLGRPVR